MTEKKKIMIFDDDEEFGENLVETLITRYGYYAELIPSITKLNTTNWNNFWNCIVSDVDFEGQKVDGHKLVRNRVVENHLVCPVIVITGKREIDLEKIKEAYGTPELPDNIFAAFMSKTDPEFESKLIRKIEEVINKAPELALARLKILFKNENKLDYVIAREELTDEILGITPREGNTTIAMLIDDCLSGNTDKVEMAEYMEILWEKYEMFTGGRY